MAACAFLIMAAVYAAPNMRPRSRDYATVACLILAAVAVLLAYLKVIR